MSLMFEEKKEEKEEDIHKPEGDEGGGNSPGFILDIASNPGKYLMYGGLVAGLIFLLTKVKTSNKFKIGVKI